MESNVTIVVNENGPTLGRRRTNAEPGDFGPGDFGRTSSGQWYCRPPLGPQHTVTEHENGTIAVTPSILVQIPGVGEWHGWLAKGWWRK